jgi:hypothetical protein
MSEKEQLAQTKRVLAWYKLQQEIRKPKKVKNEKLG